MVSGTQAKVCIKELDACLWIHLVKDSPSVPSLGRPCNELGSSYSWPTGDAPNLSKKKKAREQSNAPSVTSSPCLQLPNKRQYHPLFPTAKGNLEREKEVKDTMLDPSEEYDASSSSPTARGAAKHAVVEEKSLGDQISSVVTDAGADALAKDPKSKKGIIGSQPRGNHNVFTHCPKDPNCEVYKKTTTRARCRIKPKKRVDGIAPSVDHKFLEVENESRCGHKKNATVVQDNFTNWMQRYPMKTKDTSETMSCLQRFRSRK